MVQQQEKQEKLQKAAVPGGTISWFFFFFFPTQVWWKRDEENLAIFSKNEFYLGVLCMYIFFLSDDKNLLILSDS